MENKGYALVLRGGGALGDKTRWVTEDVRMAKRLQNHFMITFILFIRDPNEIAWQLGHTWLIFERWRHFTTTTRILQGFAFFCQLGLFSFDLFKPRWDHQIKRRKGKTKRSLVVVEKTTPSSKWPVLALIGIFSWNALRYIYFRFLSSAPGCQSSGKKIRLDNRKSALQGLEFS